MTVSTRLLRLMPVAAALGLFAGSMATAQPAPCTAASITVINNTSVPVNVCLGTSAGFFCTGNIASLGSANIAVPVGTVVGGVQSTTPITYPWQANPFPPPAWRLRSVQLNPGPACFDLEFDPTTCTVTVVGVTGPPCTRP